MNREIASYIKTKNIYLEFNRQSSGYYDYNNYNKIPLQYINKIPKNKWSYYKISRNENITPTFINQNLDYEWSYYELSQNKIITEDFIEQHINENWSWIYLSDNTNLSSEFIIKYIDKNWQYNNLLKNYNLSLYAVELIINKINSNKYSYINNSMYFIDLHNNKNLTLDFIEKYNNERWNWYDLSSSNIMTLDFIKKYMYDYRSWNFDYIILNYTLDEEFIIKLLDDKCNFYLENGNFVRELILNPLVNKKIIEKFIHKKFIFQMSINNPNISLDFINKHINNYDTYINNVETQTIINQIQNNIYKRKKNINFILKKYINNDMIYNISNYIYYD